MVYESSRGDAAGAEPGA